MPFRNPYHFVPIARDIGESIDSPEGNPLSSEILGHRTFDRYHKNTLSGRLVCQLTTVGPIVIGSKQTSDDPEGYTRVKPFERNGKPAIPSSTLRGCISAIAEAASNSALRVLHDTNYSRRVTMEDVREGVEDCSAIGMIVEEDGELRLRPLAIPTLKGQGGVFNLPEKYRKMFPVGRTQLKAFCYNRGTLASAPNAYSHEHPDYYYAELSGSYSIDRNGNVSGAGGKIKQGNHPNILLGLETVGDPLSRVMSHPYVRGILRILYTSHRDNDIKDMPQGKKHEMFIPYPPGTEKTPTFPIQEEALKRFKRLAKAGETENKRRQDLIPPHDPLPYVLKGAQPFRARDRQYQLKDKDIVFFEAGNSGDDVAKVWVSQVWKEELHSAHKFFGAVNPELLPYHQGRRTITPAEALFGFVEVNKNCETVKQARALASRVRFSEAQITNKPEGGYYYNDPNGGAIPLRILASPKPPCPSFYFRRNNLPQNVNDSRQCYISKQDLNPGAHRPQGRKFYLNHDGTADTLIERCRTQHDEHQKQKNKVTPLKEGCQFVFHIDFENLSGWELGLMIYALQPTEDFHHKIGMGKPLGLGTVKIDIAGLFYIDRRARYSIDGFDCGEAKRYQRYWLHDRFDIDNNQVFGPRERATATDGILPDDNDEKNPQKLKADVEATLLEPIKKALEKIGRPDITRINQPITQEQQNTNEFEIKTFRWFQNNDHVVPDNDRQGLVPLEYGDVNVIPRLTEN